MSRATTSLLLVAATEPELGGNEGLVCGVGPVEAAAVTARAIVLERPRFVVNVGLAGGRGLAPGTLVVGTEAVYRDLLAGVPVVDRTEPEPELLARVSAALPGARMLPIVTSATVGGGDGSAEVEAMEGFPVLRACALSDVPAVEVRAISNEIGEADRLRWDIPGALQALAAAIPIVVSTLD